MPDIVRGEVVGVFDDIVTAKNFTRQVREYLQQNNPVMAWQSVLKAEEYIEKARQQLITKEKP